MRRYRLRYSSMTASYDLGVYFAESKEEAEKECRARQTAFTNSEKSLIHAREENE